MNSITYVPHHPIIFVFDYENGSTIVPDYQPESVVAANHTCVSIRTISDVDGTVTVHLYPHKGKNIPSEDNYLLTFHGDITIPSKKVAVVSSLNEKLCELNVDRTSASISVYVDDKQFPSNIVIIVE